jgi:anti-sigma B factor antagonist
MEIHIKKHQGAMVAEVTGEIDGRTAPNLEEVVLPLLQLGGTVLLDLTPTTYAASPGLRCLLRLHREASAQRTRLVLVGMCQDIKDIMCSTGFLRFFHLAETLGEAVPPSRVAGSEPAGSAHAEEGSYP